MATSGAVAHEAAHARGGHPAPPRRRRPSLRPVSVPRRPPAAAALALLSSLAISSSPLAASAQLEDGSCSCSPLSFLFRLDLSAACPPLPPPFPPNDVFGAGVRDYTCSVGPEPIPNPNPAGADDDEEAVRVRRRLREASPFAETEDVEWSSFNFTTSQLADDALVSNPLVSDTVPVSIYSIQFLEVDTDFDVINQDSSYVRGIDFEDGRTFAYSSISGRSDKVPGGMNMVLRGVNADGEPVRNVFTITYANDCEVHAFERGEAIGWVVLEDFETASVDTCLAPSPTIAPTVVPVTPFPTEGRPEGTPTGRPAPPYGTPVPTAPGGRPPVFAKGGKGSKAAKSEKSQVGKAAKSSKAAEDSKAGKATAEEGFKLLGGKMSKVASKAGEGAQAEPNEVVEDEPAIASAKSSKSMKANKVSVAEGKSGKALGKAGSGKAAKADGGKSSKADPFPYGRTAREPVRNLGEAVQLRGTGKALRI